MEIDSRKMNRMVGIYEQLDRAGHLFGVYLQLAKGSLSQKMIGLECFYQYLKQLFRNSNYDNEVDKIEIIKQYIQPFPQHSLLIPKCIQLVNLLYQNQNISEIQDIIVRIVEIMNVNDQQCCEQLKELVEMLEQKDVVGLIEYYENKDHSEMKDGDWEVLKCFGRNGWVNIIEV